MPCQQDNSRLHAASHGQEAPAHSDALLLPLTRVSFVSLWFLLPVSSGVHHGTVFLSTFHQDACLVLVKQHILLL